MTDMDAINDLVEKRESLVLTERLKLYAQMSFVREVEELIAENTVTKYFGVPSIYRSARKQLQLEYVLN